MTSQGTDLGAPAAIPLVVTLDGPAGVGKTTLAKRLAEHLGVAYLDTGAMYRAVAHRLGRGCWEWPEDKLRDGLGKLVFGLSGAGGDSVLSVNNVALGEEIRTEEVGMWGSNVAVLPVVRRFLTRAQRELGGGVSLVAEGRDMGTVVFPSATRKFFLDATPEERAKRRHRQLRAMGKQGADLPGLAELEAVLRARDDQDRNRAEAPLRPAGDAVLVDTTSLNVEEVFGVLLDAIESK